MFPFRSQRLFGSTPNSSSGSDEDSQHNRIINQFEGNPLNLLLEKREHYLRTFEDLLATKLSISEGFSKVEKDIEARGNEIMHMIREYHQELRAKLQERTMAKFVAYDRKEKMCEEAMKYLDDNMEDFINGKADIEKFHLEFIRKIEFIETSDVFREAGTTLLRKKLAEIEKLSTGNGLKKVVGPDPCTVKFAFGSKGNNTSEFSRVWGVCTDQTGRILVSDRGNNRIQVFGESGTFIFTFGKEGNGEGEFSRPAGIAVDKKNRIIVADKNNHRIQVFTSTGRFLFSFGRQGTKPGEFNCPWGVAVNSNSDIAVSDAKNRRIQVFTRKGEFLAKLNLEDFSDEDEEVYVPRGLAFKPCGSLLVTDFHNRKVLEVNKDLKKVTTVEGRGDKSVELFRPQGIACNSTGHFAVSDCSNHQIQVFDNEENLIQVVGRQGSGEGELESPNGIAFHPNGDIIVADFGNNRIQVFSPPCV